MASQTYKIPLEDRGTAVIQVDHNVGSDNTWAAGRLLRDDHTVVATSDAMRYLCYGCDTEIVAAILVKLDESLSEDVWQILEGVLPTCECDLDEGEK